MSSRSVVLLLSILTLAGCKKADPAEQRKLLASEDPKQREKAAAEMKKLYASDPKSIGDEGPEVWAEKLKKLPTMTTEEKKAVLKTPIDPRPVGAVQTYRLDDFYTTVVTRDSEKNLVSASPAKKDPIFMTVKPAAGFTGTWTTYYVTGVPHLVEDYSAGKLTHMREMFDTGELRREADMVPAAKDGKPVMNGVVVTRFKDGKPEVEETYERGSLNGPRKEMYPNGKVRQEEVHRMGELDGWVKHYRDNGTEEWCIRYDKGKELERGCPAK